MDITAFFSSPLGIVAAAIAAFLIGSTIFNVKQWEANWKQDAIDAATAMSKAGLVHTPKVFAALAVGDLAGAFREVRGLIAVLKDPQQLAAEFQTVFQSMLDAALKDPAQAKALQALCADATAAFASGNPAASAAKLAADAQVLAGANPLFAGLAANGLSLPTLALLPQLAANPALAAAAAALHGAGLSHLLPAVAAGLNPASAPTAPSAPAAPLMNVPAGHTLTLTNNAPAPAQ